MKAMNIIKQICDNANEDKANEIARGFFEMLSKNKSYTFLDVALSISFIMKIFADMMNSDKQETMGALAALALTEEEVRETRH